MGQHCNECCRLKLLSFIKFETELSDQYARARGRPT